MAGQDLRIEIKNRVGILTLNRPDKLNAFTGDMITLGAQTLREMAVDPDVGAILLTGEGRLRLVNPAARRLLESFDAWPGAGGVLERLGSVEMLPQIRAALEGRSTGGEAFFPEGRRVVEMRLVPAAAKATPGPKRLHSPPMTTPLRIAALPLTVCRAPMDQPRRLAGVTAATWVRSRVSLAPSPTPSRMTATTISDRSPGTMAKADALRAMKPRIRRGRGPTRSEMRPMG